MARSTASDKTGYLTLGWRVDVNTLHPIYWVEHSGPRPGLQSDSDLVRAPANSLGCHTAIVAQSGSGKSFFSAALSKN